MLLIIVLIKTENNETSMLKSLSSKGMINSEQHVTIENQ